MRRLIKKSGTRTRNVAMALPASAVITKKIILPGGLSEHELEIQVETDTSDASMPAQDAGSAPAQKASSSQTVGLSDHYGLRGTFEK